MQNANFNVDNEKCNGCGLCVNVCPFHAIEKEAE